MAIVLTLSDRYHVNDKVMNSASKTLALDTSHST